MSEAYNPETVVYEKLEALEVEARQLAQKRNAAANDNDRTILERQLKEIEEEIAGLKRKLKR